MRSQRQAIVSVINDLVTDQRVNRTCLTLTEAGYDVLLVGRQMRKSLPLPQRPYRTKRMRLLFETGVPFYLEFHFRLFWVLLFTKADLLFANDLDTLMPNYIASKLKGAELVYDSHEYFTGVPELQNHPNKQRTWKWVEKRFIPRLKHMLTVNESIAGLYHEEFGIDVKVVRNLPMRRDMPTTLSRKALNLPEDKSILLLQGAGINIERGSEEAIQGMQFLDNALLLIIGGGDAIDTLKQLVTELNLNDKVRFIPKLPFEQLMQYTVLADIGLTLDKDTNINYRYSLPNKLFDYIHAGLPVLASPLIEVKKIIDQYQVGECIDSHDPREIALKAKAMLADKTKLAQYRANAIKASAILCWENEKKVLTEILKTI